MPFERALATNAFTAGIVATQRGRVAGSQGGVLKSSNSSAVVGTSTVTDSTFGAGGGVTLAQSVTTLAACAERPENTAASVPATSVAILKFMQFASLIDIPQIDGVSAHRE